MKTFWWLCVDNTKYAYSFLNKTYRYSHFKSGDNSNLAITNDIFLDCSIYILFLDMCRR